MCRRSWLTPAQNLKDLFSCVILLLVNLVFRLEDKLYAIKIWPDLRLVDGLGSPVTGWLTVVPDFT